MDIMRDLTAYCKIDAKVNENGMYRDFDAEAGKEGCTK